MPKDQVEPLVAELDALGLSARPSVFRRGTIACTGIEFCKLAIVETKVTRGHRRRRAGAPPRRPRRVQQLPQALSLHINGCPNSCARIQTADIGLKGMMLPTPDGDPTPGFQVHLGGGLASDGPRRGRPRTHRPRPEGVRRRTCRTTSSAWSAKFVAERAEGQTFAEWAHAADEEASAVTHCTPLRTARRAQGPRRVRRRRARLGRPGPRGHRLGGRATSSCPPSPSPAPWPTPSCRHSSRTSCPASTCSSWRPATTSRRPTRPATRSRRTCASTSWTCCRRTPCEQQDRLLGKDLFARDAAQCCALRKVAPLRRTLAGYELWFTGVRRDEAPTRTNTPLVTWDEANGLVKVNPVAAWTLRPAGAVLR